MNRLSPLEIQRSSFPRRPLGFDPDAVRDFLVQIAEQVEEDTHMRGELKAQLAKLCREIDEHRKREEALERSLLAAEEQASATLARAREEAASIVGEAQALADRLLDDAARRSEMLGQVISQLQSGRRSTRADLRRLAELLEGLARDDEAAEAREGEASNLALLRPRDRQVKGER